MKTTETITRSLADIEADIERAQLEYNANEATIKQMNQSADHLQAVLDQRIKETFAGEFAAIAELHQRVKDFRRETKPADERLYALWKEKKWASLVLGQLVRWAESEGWGGKTSTYATVVEKGTGRVRIDLGDRRVRTDRFKWVSPESLTIIREANR